MIKIERSVFLGYNTPMKETLSKISLFLFVLLLNTACNAEVIAPPTLTTVPSSTPLVFITATLPVTRTAFPSQTSLPSETPVPAPTMVGGEIQASTPEASSITSVALSASEPTPVFVAAPDDGDSIQSPAVNITLSEASIPVLSYSSDISLPEGDASDWVQFSLDGQTGQEKIISVVVDCSGNSKLNLVLLQNTVPLQKWENITCGQRHQLQLYLYVSAPYILQLSPVQDGAGLKYLAYDLTVQLMK